MATRRTFKKEMCRAKCPNHLCEDRHPNPKFRKEHLGKISQIPCRNDKEFGECRIDGCGYKHKKVCPRFGSDCDFLATNMCHHARPWCKFGEECWNIDDVEHQKRYSHPKKMELKEKKFSKPCTYFLKGNCKNGDNCSFSHKEVPKGASIDDVENIEEVISDVFKDKKSPMVVFFVPVSELS